MIKEGIYGTEMNEEWQKVFKKRHNAVKKKNVQNELKKIYIEWWKKNRNEWKINVKDILREYE